ncbi:MAG: CehA/McbA family metallohydrolase [Candidatus Latescibacteria bacterium]|nr:CehA/McbA family metallohydrolase [Candidatus Latescibacterota bacterium]
MHVRVEDEDSGQPVGCRVHFRSTQGAYFAPHGHQAEVNTAWFEDMGGDCKVRGVPYAYIAGTCQIELPVGQVLTEVVRGFEYLPLRQQLEIKPGQRHLTLKVRRAFDMKEHNFYSGDTHVHFLSSQSSHLEAAGEDLNVVHLLASLWGRLFTSWEEFTGGLAPTSSQDHLIWVSQENRQHVLGHISLLGLREMVAPMCTGGPQEDWVGGEIQALMADWAAACRSQGGLVVMPHMPAPDFENAANIVLGQADAAEMCWIWQGEQLGQGERGYYRWLNVGQKLPIVGGTDKMSNGRVLGGSRTYARLEEDEEFSFDNWCKAVKRGQTFASTGAMIALEVEGHPMGEELALRGNGGTVEVEAVAWSVWPLTAVELIVNGRSVAREYADPDTRQVRVHHKLRVNRSSWVAARCWGPHLTDAGPVMAHSSPVYLEVGGRCAFTATEGNYLLTHLEGGIAWAEKIGVFRDEAVRSRLIALFREAQEELRRRMKS